MGDRRPVGALDIAQAGIDWQIPAMIWQSIASISDFGIAA